jgi:hypothetical protein
MKLTTGIVALAITVGTAAAQNPATILQNTKNSLQDAAQQKTAASNAALQGSAAPAKPSAATAAKPGAAVPARPATAASQAASGSSQAAAKPAAAPAKPAVVPAKTAANSPATLKPASTSASSPNLKVIPTKSAQAPAANSAAKTAAAKTAPAANSAVNVVPTKTNPAASTQPAVKAAAGKAAPVPAVKPAVKLPAMAGVAANDKSGAAKLAVPAPKTEVKPTAAKADKPEEKEKDRKYSMTGKRDPFISPVVNRQSGSGCSTGKKCLDIEQIALHGVVKSDAGMIAVVTNGLNKAYFLRENDPVFNGYVLKITVDSIVFKQNFQDRLGKPFTKDVVKRITTPAV